MYVGKHANRKQFSLYRSGFTAPVGTVSEAEVITVPFRNQLPYNRCSKILEREGGRGESPERNGRFGERQAKGPAQKRGPFADQFQ